MTPEQENMIKKEAEAFASKNFSNKSSFEYHSQYSSYIAGRTVGTEEIDFYKKYGSVNHLPTCNLMQDWSESYDAMNHTPHEFRDEDYWESLLDIDTKSKTCTCGFNEAKRLLNNK